MPARSSTAEESISILGVRRSLIRWTACRPCGLVTFIAVALTQRTTFASILYAFCPMMALWSAGLKMTTRVDAAYGAACCNAELVADHVVQLLARLSMSFASGARLPAPGSPRTSPRSNRRDLLRSRHPSAVLLHRADPTWMLANDRLAPTD
jgi:hypothetical protein